MQEREPVLRKHGMLHSNTGKMSGDSIINGVIIVVVLVIIAGALWSVLGDGLQEVTDEGLCEGAGGYYNQSATFDCETSAGSGVEQTGYYPNPLTKIFDPDTGIPFLIMGAAILFFMFKTLKGKSQK